MHPDDANDEVDFQLCKAQALAAVKPYASMPIKVYALLDAASLMCADDALLREAFEEVFNRRGR